MVKYRSTVERWLWVAFAALFGLTVLAAYLPVRPLVAVFPAWGVVVLAAAVCTLVVAVIAAFGYEWPSGGGSP